MEIGENDNGEAFVMPTTIVWRYVDVLGDWRHLLLDSAVNQEFFDRDPREKGEDHGQRPGTRAMDCCYKWDGLNKFWDLVGPKIVACAHSINPLVVPNLEKQPHDMQLTRCRNGGFFAKHTDAGYPWLPGAKVSFVYYLGDRSTFHGGVLRFIDQDIDPTDDTLLVFDGSHAHEVTEVIGEDALRLTIVGYFA